MAAAADLAIAFREIASEVEKREGIAVVLTFGSTGLLAKQIAEGAPFDIFAAAHVSYIDDLVRGGHVRGDTKAIYARGRLAVFVRKDAPDKPTTLAQLADARYRKIALANPDHAPYGRAAKQALEKVGILAMVKDRLVFGENVQQALQFAQSGNADVAIVALSLTLGAAGAEGTAFTVDESMHDPLDQAIVVTARAKDVDRANRFLRFVLSDEGRAILRRSGFP